MRSSWSNNIEELTLKNEYWRKVIYTGPNMQITLMNIPPLQELGWEKHKESDQFFRVESGRGILETGTKVIKHSLKNGSAAVVPVGLWHNLTNVSRTRSLKLYTIYTPPHHPPKTLDKTHVDEMKRESKNDLKK